MIWGEVINAVRSLHLDFLEFSPTPLKTFKQDIQLHSEDFPYPKASGEFGEWDALDIENSETQEVLELHPVERALVEGPLLPIQEVIVSAPQLEKLFARILELEIEWCHAVKLDSTKNFEFLEQTFAKRWLKVKTKAGFNSLKAVSS